MAQTIEIGELRSIREVRTEEMKLPAAAGVFSRAPEYRLFTAGMVALATMLGTPAAGAALLAANYGRMRRWMLGAVVLAVGLALAAAEIAMVVETPRVWALAIVAGWVIAMRLVALSLQGSAVERHVDAGGKRASGWTALGVGIGFLTVIVAVVYWRETMQVRWGKVMVGTRDEVEYSDAATARDAAALGDALRTARYFTDRGMRVFLKRDVSGTDVARTTIALVDPDGMGDDAGLLRHDEEVVREVADAVGGLPIHVQVMDAGEMVKREGVVGRSSVNGKDEVLYFGQATAVEAAALDRTLGNEDYFTGRGTSVLVEKNEDGTVLSFVVSEGYADDPVHVTAFEDVARAVAPAVGGLPVKMRLVNVALEVKREVVVR